MRRRSGVMAGSSARIWETDDVSLKTKFVAMFHT